jgi:hypothetical protein
MSFRFRLLLIIFLPALAITIAFTIFVLGWFGLGLTDGAQFQFLPNIAVHEKELPFTWSLNSHRPTVTRRVFLIFDHEDTNQWWATNDSKSKTFASEINRANGEFLFTHELAVTKSEKGDFDDAIHQQLSDFMQVNSTASDEIIIVAHGWTANCAMVAAASLFERQISTIICLNTPHKFVQIGSTSSSSVNVPVFIQPRLIELGVKIVSFTSADFALDRYGMQGLSSARQLIGPWLAVGESMPNDLKFHNREIYDIAKLINVPNVDETLQVSSVLGPWGLDLVVEKTHQTDIGPDSIHSTRMGYIIGGMIRHGVTGEVMDYVSSIRQEQLIDRGTVSASANVTVTPSTVYSVNGLRLIAVYFVPHPGLKEHQNRRGTFEILHSKNESPLFTSSRNDVSGFLHWEFTQGEVPLLSVSALNSPQIRLNLEEARAETVELSFAVEENNAVVMTKLDFAEYRLTLHWKRVHE